jgi:hypothetical protein
MALKECPHCFTEIDSRATVCPNCRRDIVAATIPAVKPKPKPEKKGSNLPYILILLAILARYLLCSLCSVTLLVLHHSQRQGVPSLHRTQSSIQLVAAQAGRH